MSYTPDRSKCATILQGDREEQEQKWGEEYAELVRTVEAVIELNTGFYKKGVNSSTITTPIPAIDSKFSDVNNWTLGGSDGYGVFGADGQLHKEIENAKNYLTGWANPAGRTGLSVTPTQKKQAEDLLDILNDFYSGYEQNIKDAWKELADIQFCHQEKLADEEKNQGFFALAIDKIFGGLEEEDALINLQSGSVDFEDLVDETEAFPESKLTFKEQCYLLTNIFNLAKIKEEIDHGLNPSVYTGIPMKKLSSVASKENRTVLAVGEPFGFINRLTQSPSKSEFFEITNAQLSTLIPMVRLFKVIENTEENAEECIEEKEIEIIFDTHDLQGDISRMFSSNKGVRGIGVGLKSFNFAYEADNPFAIKKSISAKLTIIANSFSELLVERRRPQNNNEPFTYIDLALKTGGSETIKLSRAQSDVAIDNLNKLNFRLKAVVGWQVPVASRGLFSQELLDAIYDSAISLNLTPTVHSFNLDDNGKVTFTINYLAYGEDYFDNSNYNIFSKKEVVTSQIERALKVKKLGADCNIDEYNKFKNDDSTVAEIKKEKKDGLTDLITRLIATGKVYTLPVTQQDIDVYRAGGVYTLAARLHDKADLQSSMTPIPATGAAATEIQESLTDLLNKEEQETVVLEDTTSFTMSFFYASDLIDVVLDGIGKALKFVINPPFTPSTSSFDPADLAQIIKEYKRLYENFHKLRILLGPLEISKPDSYETTVMNIGDIPISMKNFLEFLTTKMLAKEKAEYYLTAFLNDFFNEFIVSLLNRDLCYDGRGRQKLFLHQNAITEYRKSATDDDSITKYTKSTTCNPTPIPTGLTSPYMRRLYMDNTVKPPAGLITCSPLPKPLLNVMGLRNDPRTNPGVCKEMNYLTFFAARSIPMNQVIGCKNPTNGSEGLGCYDENGQKVSDVGDHQRGIWHYQIGKDRGIVKTINLSETNSTGLAEVRFEQEGYDGLRQLRVLYDVNIKSYLDVSAYPGSYIYVEPRGFDISAQTAAGFDLTQLGIGGYHMIWKSEHSISPGFAETVIYAKWVAAKDASTVVDLEKSPEKPSKCSTGN
jgi:hypothetical protein